MLLCNCVECSRHAARERVGVQHYVRNWRRSGLFGMPMTTVDGHFCW